MALFFSLLAYYLWLQPGRAFLYLSLLICVLMPLIRTDYIIFSLLIFACSFKLHSTAYLSLAGTLLSLGAFWAAGKLAHGYSYATLFQHQFVHLLAYPAQAGHTLHFMDYVNGYFYTLFDSVKGHQTLLYIIAAHIFIADRLHGRVLLNNPDFNIPFLFFLLHFLLFPSFYPRHFVFSSLLIFIQIMLLITQGKAHSEKTQQLT